MENVDFSVLLLFDTLSKTVHFILPAEQAAKATQQCGC